jgi:1,4-dihydroxy-6-naphthoate synthase
MKLTIGYSPCPNDCFIFDALIHHKIDTEGLEFDVLLEDVETLNKKALLGELDITKLSYHAYGVALNNYILLRSGSALGFNCGPLLVKKAKTDIKNISNCIIAIPGKLTTANLLLSIAYPDLTNKQEFVFSEIEDAVLNGKVDAGLIIHENRFTYQEKGLEKIIDLGEYWDSLIHSPIPLGGIVIKRNTDIKLQQKVNRLIKNSVLYAFENPGSSMDYVKANAQAMSLDVMKKHINLYVNDFTIDLGETGINAVNLLLERGIALNLFKHGHQKLIIDL